MSNCCIVKQAICIPLDDMNVPALIEARDAAVARGNNKTEFDGGVQRLLDYMETTPKKRRVRLYTFDGIKYVSIRVDCMPMMSFRELRWLMEYVLGQFVKTKTTGTLLVQDVDNGGEPFNERYKFGYPEAELLAMEASQGRGVPAG